MGSERVAKASCALDPRPFRSSVVSVNRPSKKASFVLLSLLPLGASLSSACDDKKKIQECAERCVHEAEACAHERKPNCEERGKKCGEHCEHNAGEYIF